MPVFKVVEAEIQGFFDSIMKELKMTQAYDKDKYWKWS